MEATIMRRVLLYVLMLILFITAAACSNQEPENQEPTPGTNQEMIPAEHQEAAAIFQRQCISCHAADLSGRVGEQSNLQQVAARLSKEEMADVIKHGGQLMPAQENLSDEEIELLVEWLSTKK
jgi:cytochrome c551